VLLELDCSPSLLSQTDAATRPKAKEAKPILNVDAKLNPDELRIRIAFVPFFALAATTLSGDDIIVTLLLLD
jgi:hypothetical protein